VQRAVDVPAVDGAVTFSSSGPVARAAVTGVTLDVDGAADVIARGWLDRSGALTLPVRLTPPTVTQAVVDRAMTTVAVRAASGPLTVEAGEQSVSIPAAALLPALSMRADGATPPGLELVVDGEKLRAAALAANPGLELEPVDARIVLRDGAPAVIPSVDGSRIDASVLASAAAKALLGADRRATITPSAAPATLTTEEATALGVKEKVSTFSTNLTSNVPRTNNLRLAAKTVNGTLVLPGATFSLNAVLGKRTPEKGYSQAPVINGGRLMIDYGGGVSQMATTIYNNVFFSGLQDVRHMPHSFYISRYPEGREATVSFPTVDLVWRNDSPYAVLVEASVTKTVNVSFWSTKVYDEVIAEKDPRTNPRQPKTIYDPRPSCVTQEANPGFDVVVRRKVYKGGQLVKTQSWRTSYIAEDKVVCGPKPVDQVPSPD
jgi:vancomycin resistance protein YoaR